VCRPDARWPGGLTLNLDRSCEKPSADLLLTADLTSSRFFDFLDKFLGTGSPETPARLDFGLRVNRKRTFSGSAAAGRRLSGGFNLPGRFALPELNQWSPSREAA
jgi:hypothetical protein